MNNIRTVDEGRVCGPITVLQMKDMRVRIPPTDGFGKIAGRDYEDVLLVPEFIQLRKESVDDLEQKERLMRQYSCG